MLRKRKPFNLHTVDSRWTKLAVFSNTGLEIFVLLFSFISQDSPKWHCESWLFWYIYIITCTPEVCTPWLKTDNGMVFLEWQIKTLSWKDLAHSLNHIKKAQNTWSHPARFQPRPLACEANDVPLHHSSESLRHPKMLDVYVAHIKTKAGIFENNSYNQETIGKKFWGFTCLSVLSLSPP